MWSFTLLGNNRILRLVDQNVGFKSIVQSKFEFLLIKYKLKRSGLGLIVQSSFPEQFRIIGIKVLMFFTH